MIGAVGLALRTGISTAVACGCFAAGNAPRRLGRPASLIQGLITSPQDDLEKLISQHGTRYVVEALASAIDAVARADACDLTAVEQTVTTIAEQIAAEDSPEAPYDGQSTYGDN
jgi:hypothetical protein